MFDIIVYIYVYSPRQHPNSNNVQSVRQLQQTRLQFSLQAPYLPVYTLPDSECILTYDMPIPSSYPTINVQNSETLVND